MTSLTHLIPIITDVLTAPDVDLTKITAKSVRKSMLAANRDLDREWVKVHWKSIDKLIEQVFNTVAQSAQIPPVPTSSSSTIPDERKHEEGVQTHQPTIHPSSQPPISSKLSRPGFNTSATQKSEQELADEEFARQLSAEINASRTTRGSVSILASKKGRHKHESKGRKIKSAEKVGADSDGEDDDVDDYRSEGFGSAKKKRRREGGEGGGAKGGFSKAYTLSQPLAELTGHHMLSRPQVVKAIWDHIKANELQDPRDKRDIICDEKLKAVFRSEKINMFKMNKEIGSHLFEAS